MDFDARSSPFPARTARRSSGSPTSGTIFTNRNRPPSASLLEMAVTASVQRKRIVRAKTAVVAEQVRVAEFNFDQHFRDQIQAVVGQLEDDPGNVVHRYRASAAGCRWLIGRWERLSQMLEKDQTLLGHDRHEAIQLQGYLHFTDTLMYAEQAYLTFMHCYIAQHNHNKKYMKLLLSKYRIPNTFRRGVGKAGCRRSNSANPGFAT